MREICRAAVLTVQRLAVALGAYTVMALLYREMAGHGVRPGLVPVVAATVVVALLLHLLDHELGRVADLIVYGRRARGEQAVRGLLRRMAGTLPVDEVAPRLAETAGRTIGSPRAEVSITLSDGERWSRAWPPDAAAAGSSLSVGVRHAGATVGRIQVDTESDTRGPVERRLLDELAAPAGLALSTVRLTVDLRRRIAELDRINGALRESSRRLQTARRDEQRRLRREVDDRVLRRIDAVASWLTDRPRVPLGNDAAAAECERALEELRMIVRGIYPPRLGDAGVLVSVDGWLERARLHADVGTDEEVELLRQHPELEACMYFCAVTALEALAAAGCSRLSVRLGHPAEHPPQVSLCVSGSGDAAVSDEALRAMRDRIEAFDGTVATAECSPAVRVLHFRAPVADATPSASSTPQLAAVTPL